ncbi:Serine/arginine-rich SC35-like splicing factor SCL30A [Raphanus sativus]|nr:Serine/arginine-rich SC35-like splicing factor SCL30A [Raphanus sativus]
MYQVLEKSHLYTEMFKLWRDPRGFGFIQYVDPADAAEAKHHMEGYLLLGRELTVVFAEENRKKPTEMRTRDRGGRSNRFNDRRRSPPRYSRSPPPRRGGRTRSRSRDFNSPPPKRHQSRSVSPQERRYEKERSYSRSPPRNGSRARSGSREKVKKSYSRSRSPRRSVSPRRNRSYTPEQARSPVPRQSRSPSPRGERNGDRSPSQ